VEIFFTSSHKINKYNSENRPELKQHLMCLKERKISLAQYSQHTVIQGYYIYIYNKIKTQGYIMSAQISPTQHSNGTVNKLKRKQN